MPRTNSCADQCFYRQRRRHKIPYSTLSSQFPHPLLPEWGVAFLKRSSCGGSTRVTSRESSYYILKKSCSDRPLHSAVASVSPVSASPITWSSDSYLRLLHFCHQHHAAFTNMTWLLYSHRLSFVHVAFLRWHSYIINHSSCFSAP